MEVILEFIMELLFDGIFDGAESDSTPIRRRIVLAVVISAVCVGVMAILVLAYWEHRSGLMLGLVLLLCLIFLYVLGRMWFRIIKRLRKR